jgi:hypothetical protein
MTVTVRTGWRADRVDAAAETVAGALLPDFAAETPDPGKVELIFTDRYELLVEEFAAQEVHENRSDGQVFGVAPRWRVGRRENVRAACRTRRRGRFGGTAGRRGPDSSRHATLPG